MRANTPALLRISWAKPTAPGSCPCGVRTEVCSDGRPAAGMLSCQPSVLGSLDFCFQGCLRSRLLLGPALASLRNLAAREYASLHGVQARASLLPGGFPSQGLVFLLFCCVDATKITLAPSSADINVGDNLTLQCHASHDPTMDLTFTWTLDDFPIDFDKLGGHYRRASAVGHIILPPDKARDLRRPRPLSRPCRESSS